jgi:hypothetical protein
LSSDLDRLAKQSEALRKSLDILERAVAVLQDPRATLEQCQSIRAELDQGRATLKKETSMTIETVLKHRALAAGHAIDTARSPVQKHFAREQGLSAKADLEKHIADEKALAAFRKVKPRSMIGVWKDDTVRDHPVFMTGPAETRIARPVKLPDGSFAAPNPQGQIVVPASMVPAMIARGYFRANSVITELHPDFSDPKIPNVGDN